MTFLQICPPGMFVHYTPLPNLPNLAASPFSKLFTCFHLSFFPSSAMFFCTLWKRNHLSPHLRNSTSACLDTLNDYFYLSRHNDIYKISQRYELKKTVKWNTCNTQFCCLITGKTCYVSTVSCSLLYISLNLIHFWQAADHNATANTANVFHRAQMKTGCQTWQEQILLSNPSSEYVEGGEGDEGKDKERWHRREREQGEMEERARKRATTWLPVMSFTGGNRSLWVHPDLSQPAFLSLRDLQHLH